MGLGKSIQSLSYLGIHKELRPALVICPASLKINWQREIKKWLNEESYILTGRKSTVIPDYPFYIINYDILASEIYVGKKKKLKDDSWIFKLGGLKLKMIIGDEIQAIANNKSIRTRGFVTLRKINKETKFIALSGTPIKNRPSEFFVVLNSLAPTIFPNRWKYLNEFCDPTHNGFGWQFNGASNIEKLNKLIQPIMLRRLKKDVLKDLPLKRKIVVPMEVSSIDLKNYIDANNEFKEWIKEHKNAGLEIQKNIDRLKQLAYIAKRNSVISWIEQYLESDNKLVIGTYHKKAMSDLYEHFKKISVKIDGGVTGIKRQEAVDEFQNNKKIKLIICQILTVPGLTLTEAPATCTVEFCWNYSDHEQFEDRVHRIGQKSDSVTAYYLIALNTIEERIMQIIQDKNNVTKKILDNKDGEIFKGKKNRSILQGILSDYDKKIN